MQMQCNADGSDSINFGLGSYARTTCPCFSRGDAQSLGRKPDLLEITLCPFLNKNHHVADHLPSIVLYPALTITMRLSCSINPEECSAKHAIPYREDGHARTKIGIPRGYYTPSSLIPLWPAGEIGDSYAMHRQYFRRLQTPRAQARDRSRYLRPVSRRRL